MTRGAVLGAAAPAGTSVLAPWAVTVGLLVLIVGLLGVVAAARARRTPVWVVVLVALVVRVVVVRLSFGHTPADIGVATETITNTIHMHRDPLTVLPRYRWNFLPFMPTLYAILQKLGFAWQYTVKFPAVAADLVSTVLVGHLVGPERRRAVQWLFATSPVAILVTAVHGQVEPTAIAFGLVAFLAARRHPVAAGLALGFAVSAKTWPLIMLPGLLLLTGRRRWPALLAGSVVPPALFLAEALLYLHDDVHTLVTRLFGYRSYIGTWGWTGVLQLNGDARQGYAGVQVDEWQRVGTVALALMAGLVLLALWRHGSLLLTLGLILGFYSVTAGFGVQYLMWCLPFILVQAGTNGRVGARSAAHRRRCLLRTGLSVRDTTAPGHSVLLERELVVWSSLPVIAAGLWVLVELLLRGPGRLPAARHARPAARAAD